MSLADAVKGARYIAQQITWTDEDGTPVDLTGAALTGYLKHKKSGTITAIDGVLTPDADQVNNTGVFTWAYGEYDVAEEATYYVQFIATYGGGLDEKTLLTSWEVHGALDEVPS